MNTLDNLTQLPERGAFFAELEKRLNQANKHKVKMALLLVDLDRFHRINEQHGYKIGDQLLQKFTKIVGSVAREQE